MKPHATLCSLFFLAALTASGGLPAFACQTWLEGQQQFYDGPAAGTIPQLSAYAGEDAAQRIVGTDRRDAYLFNYRQLGINYGTENVEFQLRKELVLLCPQTIDVLYGPFTPKRVRYVKGTRPELERVVAEVTVGCGSDREKALALMRFCRDLRERRPGLDFSEYVYGGSEEQMIAKPEILCETLSRLMVALSEVAGMPGRLVMHVLGGHICTEILVDGQWAYIDPRCGIYFLKDDGGFTSVRELWQDPTIVWRQTESVKADASDQWPWSWRAWKCANMYFNPYEVNGFQNYSLADADRYEYGRLARKDTLAAGLLEVNKDYVATARRALRLDETGTRLDWDVAGLRKIDIAYRHDGFSIFFKEPPITRKDLERAYLDSMADSNAGILVWGLGPGSVFCYETKVGQIFGDGLTEPQRKLLRTGDLWVHENVTGLIKEGPGPLSIAVTRARQLGLKLYARLEMNHEYGPARDDNWLWVAFVGDLNKKHPEYRIGKGVLLDFKHKEVRDFKLAILREAVELGADGVSMDFAVYPPFFEEPDAKIMTRFVRDVRSMLDDVGKAQGRRLDLMVRVPSVNYQKLGLDWKAWVSEGLVDVIVPTHHRAPDYFDIRVDEFVSEARPAGVKVYPTLWQALGFVTTDQHPSDEGSGRRRYDKPKTQGMYFAQAMLFHRQGVEGIQLGMSEDQWRHRPWFNDLADPEKVLVADKHYMVDPISLRPGTFELSKEDAAHVGKRGTTLRIGDDIAAARRAGYEAKATLVVYCRPLEEDERLVLSVNGKGPLQIRGDTDDERRRRGAKTIDPRKQRHDTFVFEKEWWRRGEHALPVPADWWKLGENEIDLTYGTETPNPETPISITWIDLLLDYEKSAVDVAP